MSKCTWTEAARDSQTYDTDCGEAFYLDPDSTDGPIECGMKFCCFCGEALAVEKISDEDKTK